MGELGSVTGRFTYITYATYAEDSAEDAKQQRNLAWRGLTDA
jgi:hypothetical protein